MLYARRCVIPVTPGIAALAVFLFYTKHLGPSTHARAAAPPQTRAISPRSLPSSCCFMEPLYLCPARPRFCFTAAPLLCFGMTAVLRGHSSRRPPPPAHAMACQLAGRLISRAELSIHTCPLVHGHSNIHVDYTFCLEPTCAHQIESHHARDAQIVPYLSGTPPPACHGRGAALSSLPTPRPKIYVCQFTLFPLRKRERESVCVTETERFRT